MTLLPALLVLVATFVTATVSGVLGMAGGLLLMGVLLLVLPVSTAFVVHGLLQLVSNGWRAVLQRSHVQVPIVGWYAAGAVVAASSVLLVAVVPSKPVTYLLLGLVPALAWLPRRLLPLDAARPAHAATAGVLVTALNLAAGVSGPLLDVFFVRSALGRHAVVATKAATQVLSHAAKVIVYGGLAGTGSVPLAGRAARCAPVDARDGGGRSPAGAPDRRELPHHHPVGRDRHRRRLPGAGRPARLRARPAPPVGLSPAPPSGRSSPSLVGWPSTPSAATSTPSWSGSTSPAGRSRCCGPPRPSRRAGRC